MSEPYIAVMRPGEVPTDGYAGTVIHWLVSEKTNGSRELTLGKTTIEPGGSNPYHCHPNCEEALYVLSGEIEHHIEGTPNVFMKAGEAILIPRNIKHQAINNSTEPAELLVSFSSAARETVIAER